MRTDKALIFTLAAMVFLVLAGYPLLAMLAGLLGVILIAVEGDSYRSFKDVEVPKAGDYPKFDFWKGLLKDTGEFTGKLLKTFARTEQAVDKWSGWVKKGIYGPGGDTSIYMYGPFAMVLPKGAEKYAMALSGLQTLEHYKQMLLSMYNSTQDRSVKNRIMEEIKKVEELEKELIEAAKKNVKK